MFHFIGLSWMFINFRFLKHFLLVIFFIPFWVPFTSIHWRSPISQHGRYTTHRWKQQFIVAVARCWPTSDDAWRDSRRSLWGSVTMLQQCRRQRVCNGTEFLRVPRRRLWRPLAAFSDGWRRAAAPSTYRRWKNSFPVLILWDSSAILGHQSERVIIWPLITNEITTTRKRKQENKITQQTTTTKK